MAQALLDMVPAQQGDQLAGCSVGKASVPVVNLAGLHSSRLFMGTTGWITCCLTLQMGMCR